MSPHGNVGAIIQARMASARLPGKALLKLPFDGAHSMIQNIVLRARGVSSVDAVIVATSTERANDGIVASATSVGATVFRGDEDNVLERFYQIATEHGFKTVVRLTGDNPCIDPAIIEHAIAANAQCGADYTKTVGLPVGMNVEVMSSSALSQVFERAERADDKEHVSLFINRNPGQFRVNTLDLSRPEYGDVRMTVDWESDYAFACFLYEHLHATSPCFGLQEVMSLLERYPWATRINRALHTQQIL